MAPSFMRPTLASMARSRAMPKTTDNPSVAPKSTSSLSSRRIAPTVVSGARCATPPSTAAHSPSRSDNPRPATPSKPRKPRYGRSHSRPGPCRFTSQSRSERHLEKARKRAEDLCESVTRYPTQRIPINPALAVSSHPILPAKSTWAKAKTCVSAGVRRLVKANDKSPVPNTVQAQSGPTAKKAGQDKKITGLAKALAVCGLSRKKSGRIQESVPRKSALTKPGSAPRPRKMVRFVDEEPKVDMIPRKDLWTRELTWQKREKTPRGADYDWDERKWI